jgi:hypothetical protein
MGEQRELPRYQCHKKVWALKIKSIVLDAELAKAEDRDSDGSAMITPEDPGYAPFRADRDYVHKHRPEAGGYYVVYDDGYASWSPSKAFEDGYSLIA